MLKSQATTALAVSPTDWQRSTRSYFHSLSCLEIILAHTFTLHEPQKARISALQLNPGIMGTCETCALLS